MTISLAASLDSARSAYVDAIIAKVDAGAAAGTLKVYTGTKPATPATTASGTLLATFTLADPSAAAAVAGVATADFDPALSATTAAAGTPGWFRVADSDGNAVFDGTCGASGADLNFSATTWVSGQTVTLDTGTITTPA